jgi:hypothetical protein
VQQYISRTAQCYFCDETILPVLALQEEKVLP